MKILKAVFICLMLIGLYSQLHAQGPSINNVLRSVGDKYLAINTALGVNDGKGAANKAKEMLAAINAVSVAQMSASQQTIWTDYKDKLSFDARHISEVPRVAHQKEHFARLTKNMHAMLKRYGMDREGI